ncbi:helix-turn-helix transcriptional regulator [Methylobacterium terricola]|uniref:Helix-turn-helix transcriptional regulator n=1 Tax=Methylobacterium terricola TaxID=2583531 RepID=A0A5C4L762_9HYPH|nr:helix-turn-helix transcriptional regulator [Methylobacterium terricola]TNC07637.1 helix-turn-helix transcriptional regulator [Methylobacterium terricola]
MDGRTRVARNLRRIRSAQGISQEALAIDANVDRTYVSGIERRVFNPTVDILDRLADALSIDVSELFNKLDNADPEPSSLRSGRRSSK